MVYCGYESLMNGTAGGYDRQASSARDDYPLDLAAVLDLLEKQGPGPARAELEKIGYPEQDVPSRKSPPMAMRLKVFQRDRFHCLYCQRKVIFFPVFHLIGRLFPDIFPHTPYWRGGKTHPAVILCSAMVEPCRAWLLARKLARPREPCDSL